MNRRIWWALFFSAITSTIVLGTAASQFVITTRYTSVALIALAPMLGLLCMACLMVAVIVLGQHWEAARWRATLPLIVLSAACLFAIVAPWETIYRDAVWRRNERGYAEVIDLIKSGKLRAGDAELQAKYARLSVDGRISTEGTGASTAVFFLVYQDMKRCEAGYLYVPDGVSPAKVNVCPRREITSIKPHWYFVVYEYE